MKSRSGGRCLVEQLDATGVERIFCVPGESYLAVLDALNDTPAIGLTVARQEGGASMMAAAHGRLTGRPGVCFVTRGPGMTNAMSGLHVAAQDGLPLVLFAGLVPRRQRDRGAFQDIDITPLAAGTAKWAVEVPSADRIPEITARALAAATGGRPGPVVVGLPEDVLTDPTAAAPVSVTSWHAGVPAGTVVDGVVDALSDARRPLLLVGGPGWTDAAKAGAEAAAARHGLPAAVSFRRQDGFANDHPCYAGDLGLTPNPALAERVRAADLILAVGSDLGDVTTGGHRLIESPRPRQRLIHVHADPAALGRWHQADTTIQADPAAFLDALAARPASHPLPWEDAAATAHGAYLTWSRPLPVPGRVQLGHVVAWLNDRLPPGAVVTNGAGNYAAFVGRYVRYTRHGTQLAPTSGSMGFGLPAAIAAKLHAPGRPVVAFAGDGCFQMTGQELATAVQADARLVVIVVNNRMHGTIRMHQETHYPGRVVGTDLGGPDFAALARAHGAAGETVTSTAAFPAAFERALAAGRPAVIELVVDPDAIAPGRSLTAIRQAATG